MDNQLDNQEREWQKKKDDFYMLQNDYNNKINELFLKYENKQTAAIERYNQLILENSNYPFLFIKKVEVLYSAENKVIAVEYNLPIPEDLPTIKDERYIARSNEFRQYHFTETQMNKKYDIVIVVI